MTAWARTSTWAFSGGGSLRYGILNCFVWLVRSSPHVDVSVFGTHEGCHSKCHMPHGMAGTSPPTKPSCVAMVDQHVVCHTGPTKCPLDTKCTQPKMPYICRNFVGFLMLTSCSNLPYNFGKKCKVCKVGGTPPWKRCHYLMFIVFGGPSYLNQRWYAYDTLSSGEALSLIKLACLR